MQKTCKQCSLSFEITDEDLRFYDKVSPVFVGKKYLIPPPTLCPECRQQRRLTFRNERSLYHRKCDLTGKQIISIYSPDKPYKVYHFEEWFSDKWDPIEYGRDFDFNRPFFEQFYELSLSVPRVSLYQSDNVNCDYINHSSKSSDCYLVFAASACQNCFYSTSLQRNNYVLDSLFVFDSEFCYECIDCYNAYNLFYSQFCDNCSESHFLYNCKGCANCFGCVSLINKKYHIFNKEYSKEEYFRNLNKLRSSKDFFEKAKKVIIDLRKKLPQKYFAGIQNEEVTGDHISFSKKASDCFDCTYLENCKHCVWFHQAKDCHDCYAFGLTGELGYEIHAGGYGFYNIQFCDCCWNSVSNLLYSQLCIGNNQHLFGCIGLRHKKFCILNKQYTQQEYEKLVPKIIEHMKKTGEWGEFFPTKYGPFTYNESIVFDYFPLIKEEVLKNGWKWYDQDEKQAYKGPVFQIPENIKDVTDDITKQILICEVTGKPYKIIPQELKFYREHNLPIPRRCPDQRHKDRLALRNPRKLWDRKCMKCGKNIKTTYSPDRPEIVYCEECYLKEVY